MRTIRLLPVLAVLALCALLPACGGEDVSIDGSALAKAADNASRESSRFTMTMSSPEQGGFEMAGSGVATADGNRGRMRMTVDQDGQKLRMTAVVIGEDVWVSSRDFQSEMPKGKRWVHSAQAGSPQSMSPSEFAAFLRDAEGVEEVGAERIRGQETTHYKGEVDIKKLAKATGEEAVKFFEQQLGGENPRIGIEAWLTEGGMPQRMKLSIGKKLSMAFDVLEYGVPVEVEPPAARLVVEEKDAFGGAGG